MLPKEFTHSGDGIIQVSKPEYLKKILVEADIEQHYIVEEKPFARWVDVERHRKSHSLATPAERSHFTLCMQCVAKLATGRTNTAAMRRVHKCNNNIETSRLSSCCIRVNRLAFRAKNILSTRHCLCDKKVYLSMKQRWRSEGGPCDIPCDHKAILQSPLALRMTTCGFHTWIARASKTIHCWGPQLIKALTLVRPQSGIIFVTQMSQIIEHFYLWHLHQSDAELM